MKEKKKLVLFGIGGLLVLFLVIGVSYAIWQLVLQQTNENIVTTGCFKLVFEDENNIVLDNAYPVDWDKLDEYLSKAIPYHFTITNTCDSPARASINLETLPVEGKRLDDQYIDIEFYNGTKSYQEIIEQGLWETDFYKEDILTNIELNENRVIENALNAYSLYQLNLNPKETREFHLLIYMDPDTSPLEETMNASWKSKVTVSASYFEPEPGTLRVVSSSNPEGMWDYKENITKLVIQKELKAVPNAIAVNDESELKDGSIMSYIVPNEKVNESDETTYTAYLQSNRKLYLNQDSSWLFYNFNKLTSIEGIKYLDTTNVTNMINMFGKCSSLTSLDLSNFDTTNVTTMVSMFNGCNSLTNLNLSNFNTTNVTNMTSMFYECNSLTSMDLSHFTTTKVTYMAGMFYSCSSLENLDLSSFDTSNVIDMHSMFYGCSSLTTLDLKSFNTSNVLRYYFHDNSPNDGGMFQDCTNLTTITYGENFVYKSGATANGMFYQCPANKPTHESWNGVTF